jgi:hypothetical protein
VTFVEDGGRPQVRRTLGSMGCYRLHLTQSIELCHCARDRRPQHGLIFFVFTVKVNGIDGGFSSASS